MSLAYDSFGTGRPIVLIHGLFGSGDNLRVLARGLESRYHVVLPDLPNHGTSRHTTSSTHDSMADEIEEFIHDESLISPILAGHSIGGKVAILISLRHPDRVPALISIDIAPRRYEATHVEMIAPQCAPYRWGQSADVGMPMGPFQRPCRMPLSVAFC